MSYSEWKYYQFGLKVGFGNLRRNGLTLGAKKTLGKILQPINSYARFPEYHFMERAIATFLRSRRGAEILDIGSPKMFGFYLAAHYPVALRLTDFSAADISEYRTLWRGVGRTLGQVSFEVQDVRALTYPNASFDVVYSMSVLEHIGGDQGDVMALTEIVRVLKPGGLLVFSIPYGPRYVEQSRRGFAYGDQRNGKDDVYFFARIYDRNTLHRMLPAVLDSVSLTTISRRHHWLLRTWGMLHPNIRGLLGLANPLISLVANESRPMLAEAPGEYERLHRPSDFFGDVIISGRRTGDEATATHASCREVKCGE